jgi:hypothetical protein
MIKRIVGGLVVSNGARWKNNAVMMMIVKAT